MEFKGNKGKWALLKGYNLCGISIGNKSTMVFSNGDDEELANAQLIAHAPEMLEYLNKISNFIELNEDKNYMIELLNREVPGLSELIKSATEIK